MLTIFSHACVLSLAVLSKSFQLCGLLPGLSVHVDSPGKNTWSRLPCPPPGDLPNLGIKPRYPTLQVDSLLSEPKGNPGLIFFFFVLNFPLVCYSFFALLPNSSKPLLILEESVSWANKLGKEVKLTDEYIKASGYIELKGFSGGAVVKILPASAGDTRNVSLIRELERCTEVGNGSPLQYSCLEDSMDSGSWQATVHGVGKSQIWLSTHTYRSSACSHITFLL